MSWRDQIDVEAMRDDDSGRQWRYRDTHPDMPGRWDESDDLRPLPRVWQEAIDEIVNAGGCRIKTRCGDHLAEAVEEADGKRAVCSCSWRSPLAYPTWQEADTVATFHAFGEVTL